jgi:hypothetical protein
MGQSFFRCGNRVKRLDELSKTMGRLSEMNRRAGGEPRSLRRSGEGQIIALLLAQVRLCRAELMRSAGVSRTTVSTTAGEPAGRSPITTVDEETDGPLDDHAGNRLFQRPSHHAQPQGLTCPEPERKGRLTEAAAEPLHARTPAK